MLLNRKCQKIAILLIILLLGLNSVGVYGESMFTDIDHRHWAYEYVKKVVDLGLMDGYDDATFRPNEEVNTADALIYVTRLFNLSTEEVQSMRQKYDNLLNKFELSEERKDGLAIALSKGLVTEIFVENNLFVKGKIRTATKVELSIYIAKALGIKETNEEVFVFLYNDTDSIPERARPYIKYLIDNGILEAKGDSEGKFNPDQPVIRSVLAKMLYLSYDKLDISPVVVPGETIKEPERPDETPIEKPIKEDQEQLTGIITGIIDRFIFIDNGQRVDSYTLDKDALITIDDQATTIEELELGMNIKARIGKDNIIKSLTVDKNNDIISGTIDKIIIGNSSSLIVNIADGDTRTFHIPKDTKVWINGEESHLFSLKEGDWVKIEVFDNLVLSIASESRDGKVVGIIKDRDFDEEYTIQVERKDSTVYEYQLRENLLVYRNSNGVTIKELRKGDEVALSLTDGEVAQIEAKSIPGEDKGVIKEILISKESKLTILNDQEELIDYYISPKAQIRIDKEIKSLYDLRLDYYAKLKLESDEIVNIEIEKQGRE
ncbi:S-layer homology domain-containing protein [Clostridium sp. Cult1]|uniref:S-layer homology domain-containing protein n=1 Tax=Clostridium sp. Cult1 TaxID=2079002 RepID=UPI001F38334C|nr:S-layer homology domain-containing protein [Clostridium sp. Cult1]MCF6463460.1 hypothetical protein [Clostridium sp. Cult1]